MSGVPCELKLAWRLRLFSHGGKGPSMKSALEAETSNTRGAS